MSEWDCGMFSRDELIAEFPRLAAADSPPIEAAEYGHQDFEVPCSEQCIYACRGSRRDFGSALLFWVKSLQAQDWNGRQSYFRPYAEAGLCEPIGAAEFAGLVAEYSRSLRLPLPEFLLRLDGFRSGLQMYAEWNDVGAVAELADEFVAFYWSTTA